MAVHSSLVILYKRIVAGVNELAAIAVLPVIIANIQCLGEFRSGTMQILTPMYNDGRVYSCNITTILPDN